MAERATTELVGPTGARIRVTAYPDGRIRVKVRNNPDMQISECYLLAGGTMLMLEPRVRR